MTMGDDDPWGVANLDPRGMIGRIYVEYHLTLLHTKYSKEWAKLTYPRQVAIRGCNTFRGNLFGEKEKRNKGTDKQYVADSLLHSTTCHIKAL